MDDLEKILQEIHLKLDMIKSMKEQSRIEQTVKFAEFLNILLEVLQERGEGLMDIEEIFSTLNSKFEKRMNEL